MSIKNILVPTDFSEVANSAVNVAAEIARKSGATLHLLNIVHVPVIDPYTPAQTISNITDTGKDEAQKNLAKLSNELEGVNSEIYVKAGFAIDEILGFATANDVDLIVMGTTGSSGVEEVLLGSNAAGVVEKSKIPVLCIPDEMEKFAAKDIVYASDLEKNDIAVINKLLDVAKVFNSNFHILHVHNDEMHFTHDNPEDIFRAVKDQTGYPSLSYHQVEAENTRATIEEFIEKMPCDILAMAKHHRSFFDKLFHSSLTKKMVNHSHIPVLTYYK
jgi:nucleotide-binding universal stress UspA family protein